jgi:tetratricopeptide (TPR) repeat protein
MPEKTLSEISRPLREQYEKGVAAFQRQNVDYAISILNQVLEKEPGFYECREALRAAQFRKAGGSTSFFKRFLGSANPMLAKGQLVLRSDPVEALHIAEHILNGDPHNSGAHRLLAEAALQADFPKTAVLSLEIVAKSSPKDKDAAMKLCDALVKTGQVAKAEKIYAELARTHPNDQKVAQGLKNMSASRTLKEGGYDALAGGSGSYRDILRNKEEAVALEQEHREVKSEDVAERLIGEYEARLLHEPDNLKLIRLLAELYTQKKDFDKALEYYQRSASSEGGVDPALEQAIAETTAKKFDYAIEQLDANASDYAEQKARLEAERQTYLLAECQQRADKYPSDLQIRFELGQLYFQAGKISEAIQEFQKAQNNPHRRSQALSYLGQCFARRGMNDLAARTLQNAINEKVVFDDEKKELIYALGCVLEKMDKREGAIEQFKQIYEVDIAYKDVGAKVDAYYSGK